jgi:hypothetical protein
MAVDGRVEHSDGVQHFGGRRMENYGKMLEGLSIGSQNFR